MCDNKNAINTKMNIGKKLKENALLIMTILAVVLGLSAGLILRSLTNFSKPTKSYFGFPGEIFLRAIKLMILPLVSSSIIIGIAGGEVAKLEKMARQTILIFVSTKALAAIVSGLLAFFIKPGSLNRGEIQISSVESEENFDQIKLSIFDDILDLVRNMIPENMIEMCFEIYQSKVGIHYKPVNNLTLLNENGIFYYGIFLY